MEITFIVPGEPVGKGRPRFAGGRAYTPRKTEDYETMVRLLFMAAAQGKRFPRHVPVEVRIWAHYAIPASDSRRQRDRKLNGEVRPCKTPDADNVAKVVLDALNGQAFEDDAQVVELHVAKFYAAEPRVEICVREA